VLVLGQAEIPSNAQGFASLKDGPQNASFW